MQRTWDQDSTLVRFCSVQAWVLLPVTWVVQEQEWAQQAEQWQQEDLRVAKKKKSGLYANIHAKRKRIAGGSGERMKKPGEKGRPTASQFKRSAKTAKKKK